MTLRHPAGPSRGSSGIASVSGVVARPRRTRDLAEGMELIVILGMRVLHGDLRAELDVLADGLTEGMVSNRVRGSGISPG